MRIFLLAAAALFLASCGGKDPVPEPLPTLVGESVIENVAHSADTVRYEIYRNRITERDVVGIKVWLSDNAGINVELDSELLDQRVEIGKGAKYWFFSIGTNAKPRTSFDNNDPSYYGYTGWFAASLDSRGVGSLNFDIQHDGSPFAHGSIAGPFEQMKKFEE